MRSWRVPLTSWVAPVLLKIAPWHDPPEYSLKDSSPVPVVGFISTHASDPEAAKALLQYLASPEAAAIWKEAGYEPPS